ncbi:MAG: hypothetical protein FJ264_07885 [Planctomycetes bacterium]|nr:hypothetical protein [Planctomycetota bacterium]
MVYLEIDDDHYIVNARNAHIDTAEFEEGILAEVRNNSGIADEALVELIYNKAFSMTAAAPVNPGDDVLICRYLTPTKFIKFLDTRQIAFPIATQFSDKRECVVPEDYDHAVLRTFAKLKRSGTIWAKYVRSKASAWNISCWTELSNYFDDHLMWEAYAGGSDGIGITIRYGQLRSYLLSSVGK